MKSKSILVALVVLISCAQREKIQTSPTSPTPEVTIKYAQGFKVTSYKGCKRVDVTYPYQGATKGFSYLLVPHDQPVPDHEADVKIIRTPLQSIVCTSTTHIPLLDYLDETNKLVGFPSTDYISFPAMRKRIDAGLVKELGQDSQLNIELLAALKPASVMAYTMSSDYGQFKKIEELGIPVVINSEYLERDPLGRAEWIKFMACFFNEEKKADSVFNAIEKKYIALKTHAENSSKPTVLCGIVYNDSWFLPGGQNYASKLLKDAGCQYLWASDSSHGYLQLSFESVFKEASHADLWIGVGTYNNLREIEAADKRYAKFKPFIEKEVYTFNGRRGAKGGSEFLELGYLRPDLVLKDLVIIAHPERMPHDTLYFHKKLE